MAKRNEFILHDFIKDNLSEFFEIEHEKQSGRHRPDFIVTCREYGFKAIIEVKDATVCRGSEVYDWLQQSKRYSKHFKLPVFVFPQISYRVFDEGVKSPHKHRNDPHNNVSTFIGRMGVGEISATIETQDDQFGQKVKYNCIQFYHSGWVIWSNRWHLRNGVTYNESRVPKHKDYIR
jgi:hypothetical protein